MPGRLSEAVLGHLPQTVVVPRYDRRTVTPGIVHLGVGAFHRAHQAVTVDDRLAAGETGWGIVGASLRSPDTRDALRPQDGLYTVVSRTGEASRPRVIGSILDILVAPENPAALLDRLTDPRTRIVTLTITEKAYLRAPSGDLDANHADIRADLATPALPRTAHGFLVEAIARRRAAGVAPFTVASCDNLPANGETLHRLLVQFAALRDPALAVFMHHEVPCPSSMVDRIVPATTDADRAFVTAELGVHDAWPIVTEPFTQWVIEDRFASGRPRFEEAGAEMVRDVAPFELMKLRLLNGSHSAIAYLGLIAGKETVAESFGTPDIRAFVGRLWAQAAETLPKGAGLDPSSYIPRLTSRYDNTALKHRCAQIANDGSQKLPQRLIGSALDRMEAGHTDIAPFALAVAAWIAACSLRGRGVEAFTDPLDAVIDARLAQGGEPAAVTADLFEAAGFAHGSAHRAGLIAAVAGQLRILRERGVHAALEPFTVS